jgi:predicted molibdopterin-dependent oxidoreductase YjgC
LAEAAALPDTEPEELLAIQQLISQAEYLVVCDAVFTATAEIADIYLPGSAPVAAAGTYTNTEGRVQETAAVVYPPAGYSNLQIALRLLRASAVPNGNPQDRVEPTDEEQLAMYLNEYKLATQQADSNPAKRSETLTVHLSQVSSSGRLVSVLPTADALTRLVDQKLALAMS